LLDEPSSGLDPVVRRDILGAIIRTIADEGRTVVFSSHLLEEVERVADRVAIVHEGRVVLTSQVDRLKETHRRITLRFDVERSEAPRLVGATSAGGVGVEWTYICHGEVEQVRAAAVAIGASIVDDAALTLDEIFVNRVGA
jgi:ABC-2 type transport system ATP-binding protein